MSTPYLGQLMLFPMGYAPKGWMTCAGQLLPINQYQALFSLLGTNFGGNGVTNFGLPNLQGRAAVMAGGELGLALGATAGEENHALSTQEMPAHLHQLRGSSAAASASAPAGNLPATTSGNLTVYAQPPAAPDTPMNGAAVATAGGGQPHSNQQPYLVLNWCIALQGVFPSQN